MAEVPNGVPCAKSTIKSVHPLVFSKYAAWRLTLANGRSVNVYARDFQDPGFNPRFSEEDEIWLYGPNTSKPDGVRHRGKLLYYRPSGEALGIVAPVDEPLEKPQVEEDGDLGDMLAELPQRLREQIMSEPDHGQDRRLRRIVIGLDAVRIARYLRAEHNWPQGLAVTQEQATRAVRTLKDLGWRKHKELVGGINDLVAHESWGWAAQMLMRKD